MFRQSGVDKETWTHVAHFAVDVAELAPPGSSLCSMVWWVTGGIGNVLPGVWRDGVRIWIEPVESRELREGDVWELVLDELVALRLGGCVSWGEDCAAVCVVAYDHGDSDELSGLEGGVCEIGQHVVVDYWTPHKYGWAGRAWKRDVEVLGLQFVGRLGPETGYSLIWCGIRTA